MLGWLWYQHWNMNSECMIPLSFKQWINMEDIDSSSVFWCFHLCHLNRQTFNCFWKRNLEQFAWISAAFIQITIEMGKSKWMQYSAEKPARTRNTNLPVVKVRLMDILWPLFLIWMFSNRRGGMGCAVANFVICFDGYH